MDLSASELAELREDLESTLPDSAVISAVSYQSDGAGEWIPTWSPAGTVAARVDPSNGIEVLAGGAIQAFHRYTLTLPYDAPISEASRVRVAGVDYAVISVTQGDSWKLDTRAQIEKI